MFGLLGLAVSNPLLALGGIAVAVAAAWGAYAYVHHDGFVEGKEEVQAEWDVAKENQRTANRVATNALAGDVTKIRSKKDAQIASINARLNTALTELRSRPERGVPDPAGAGCPSATGAELSRPDAEFLEREAARADSTRTGLAACYEELDSLRLRFGASISK